MDFKLLSPTEDARFIQSVRKAVLISLKTPFQERLCMPIPHATYLGLETKDGLVGIAEALPLNLLYPLITSCPFAGNLTHELTENYDRICHLRTIYVYPEFRKSFYYLYLALGMTFLFNRRKAAFATAVTAATDTRLTNLYRRTGGNQLGNFTYPAVSGVWTLFGFTAENLLAHPLAPRVEEFIAKRAGH